MGDANNFLNAMMGTTTETETGDGLHQQPKDGDSDQNRKRKRDQEKKEILPLHLRPRKLNFWDQSPEGYGNMSADQVKATGMFLLPSHLLKGTGSFSQPSIVQPYGGTGLIGYGNQQLMHDPSTAKLGYHTKRLYISGLAGVECTEEELIQWLVSLFEERGLEKEEGNPIETLSIHEKGFAFAEMRSSQEATTALVLNGSEFMGHPIKIARPKDYRPGEEDPEYVPGVVSTNVQDTAQKIFIGGLPPYVTDDQVLELLKAFGELKSFNLVKNADTGLSKGFAFCEYVNGELTDLACSGLHGLELGDKKLIVQRAHVGTSSRLPMIEGALPGAGLGKAILPIEILGASGLKPAEPTTILLLLNLFDAAEITNKDEISTQGDHYADLVELDVRAECERFGTVADLVMPRPGKRGDPPIPGVGRIFCKYETKEECAKAQRALAGRRFNGRTVCSTFFDEQKFESGLF